MTTTTIEISARAARNFYTGRVGWWFSADRQGMLDMREAWCPANAIEDMLSQCDPDNAEQIAEILDGTLQILPSAEDIVDAAHDLVARPGVDVSDCNDPDCAVITVQRDDHDDVIEEIRATMAAAGWEYVEEGPVDACWADGVDHPAG